MSYGSGSTHRVAATRGVRPAWRLRMAAARTRFRESLFQLPALIVLGGIVAAELTARVDESWSGAGEQLWTLDMGASAATWLLSTVAGAMITTAGVVFSLTVVSLQLASSQFSPRVMRTFIRDRLSQVVIGLLVATFVFCVLTLRRVDEASREPAPALSLTVAVLLTVATVLLIIAHLNHLADRLQVGQVARAIAAEGERTLDDLGRMTARERPVSPEAAEAAPAGEGGLEVLAPRDGWVTQAPSDEMFAAVPAGSTVRLETRAGAYIHEGEVLVTVQPQPDDAERVARAVAGTVEVSDVRTMQLDVDFALRQLVDVGLRALSPAINDPTTAVEVVLRVGGLLRRLLDTDLPAPAVAGDDDKVLLRPWELTHEEYVRHGLDQLRQSAGGQTQVLAALLRTVRMLITHVREVDRPEHLPVLERHLQLVRDAVEAAPLHPHDRDRLRATAREETDPADHAPEWLPDSR